MHEETIDKIKARIIGFCGYFFSPPLSKVLLALPKTLSPPPPPISSVTMNAHQWTKWLEVVRADVYLIVRMRTHTHTLHSFCHYKNTLPRGPKLNAHNGRTYDARKLYLYKHVNFLLLCIKANGFRAVFLKQN